LSSQTLNEFRFGFTRFSQHEFQGRAGKTNVVRELGMIWLVRGPSCWGIPQMSVTGFAQFGEHGGQSVSGPRAWRNEAYQWQDNFYHTAGAHSVKLGAVVRRHRDNFPEAIDPRGVYTYNGFLTSNAFADFLLGYPRNTLTSIDIFSPHFRNTVVEPWIQDDWRVTPELTLNLGLRWEWAGRPVSKDNTISTVIFDQSGARLITAKNPEGYPAALAYDDFNNFAPRFGFAYNPKFLGGKTVLRGAYGTFYQRELANTWVDLAINDPLSVRPTSISTPTQTVRSTLPSMICLGPQHWLLPLHYLPLQSIRTGGTAWCINGISTFSSPSASARCSRWPMWAIVGCGCPGQLLPTSRLPAQDPFNHDDRILILG
jgi:hypothetical protein